MRKLYILFVIFPLLSFSQTKITGSVKNNFGEVVYGASVTIDNAETNAIIAYAITDEKGNFSINLNSTLKQFSIIVRILGYKEEQKLIGNKTQNINFVLSQEITKLKEIEIESSPITQKGDTISYNVSSFANNKDRTIADVLSKMPGIDVLSDGKILYQGKPINKYYIEGLDLLEGKYNLANKNLPFDQVSKVEILENHQPIKVLDSLVFSDKAALNIKLKNNVSFTGQAELGIGASPLLWENNITPMLFSKSRQMVSSYQSNNTGNNLSSQLKTLTLEDLIENFESNNDKKDWLNIQELNRPSFLEKRWLDNNIHLISLNYLQKLNHNLELRVNVSYLNDYQKQEGSTKTLFFAQNDTISITENNNNRIFNNSLQSNFTIKRNTKNKYLKNSFKYKGFWDSQNGVINSNDVFINQNLKNHYYSVSNNFKNIFSLGKHLLTLNSYVSYNKTPQTLDVNPGPFESLLNDNSLYNNLKQNVDLRSLFTNNTISFTKGINQFTITPKLGFKLEKQKLETELFIENIQIENSDFYNQLNWFKSELYTDIQIQYKKKNWRFELESPVSLNHFNINDDHLNKKEGLNKLVFEPRISVINDLSSFWKISSSFAIKNKFGSIDDLHFAYILRNYRNIQRINSIIPQSITKSYNAGISYRNPIKSLFGNLIYSYSSSKNNILFNANVLENGSVELKAIEQENIKNSNVISGSINQYIPKIKSNFKFSTSWSSLVFNQILNNTLTEVNTQNSNITLKSNTDVLSWFDIEYQAKWNISKSKLENRSNNTIRKQSHLVNLNLHPKKNQYIGVKTEYLKSNLFTGNNVNLFADIIYRYTCKNKNIDFEVQWNNVFNTKTYRTVNIDDFSYIETNFSLRPSQVLFKVRFSL